MVPTGFNGRTDTAASTGRIELSARGTGVFLPQQQMLSVCAPASNATYSTSASTVAGHPQDSQGSLAVQETRNNSSSSTCSSSTISNQLAAQLPLQALPSKAVEADAKTRRNSHAVQETTQQSYQQQPSQPGSFRRQPHPMFLQYQSMRAQEQQQQHSAPLPMPLDVARSTGLSSQQQQNSSMSPDACGSYTGYEPGLVFAGLVRSNSSIKADLDRRLSASNRTNAADVQPLHDDAQLGSSFIGNSSTHAFNSSNSYTGGGIRSHSRMLLLQKDHQVGQPTAAAEGPMQSAAFGRAWPLPLDTGAPGSAADNSCGAAVSSCGGVSIPMHHQQLQQRQQQQLQLPVQLVLEAASLEGQSAFPSSMGNSNYGYPLVGCSSADAEILLSGCSPGYTDANTAVALSDGRQSSSSLLQTMCSSQVLQWHENVSNASCPVLGVNAPDRGKDVSSSWSSSRALHNMNSSTIPVQQSQVGQQQFTSSCALPPLPSSIGSFGADLEDCVGHEGSTLQAIDAQLIHLLQIREQLVASNISNQAPISTNVMTGLAAPPTATSAAAVADLSNVTDLAVGSYDPRFDMSDGLRSLQITPEVKRPGTDQARINTASLSNVCDLAASSQRLHSDLNNRLRSLYLPQEVVRSAPVPILTAAAGMSDVYDLAVGSHGQQQPSHHGRGGTTPNESADLFGSSFGAGGTETPMLPVSSSSTALRGAQSSTALALANERLHQLAAIQKMQQDLQKQIIQLL